MNQFTPVPSLNHVGVRRAGIYARVSSEDQAREGTSLATQERGCRALATASGNVVDETHVYRETFTGVELWERPDLTRLRAAIRTRAIDVLYCFAIDRLSRDPVHLGVILSEAEHAGVEVRFVTEPLDDSPEGQLIRFVRGYAAKVEHEKIKERTMRGRRARVEAGKYPGVSRPPYGYRWVDATRARLIEEPTTGTTVRRIFQEIVAGASARAVARRLTAEGVPTPAGKDTWSPTTVIAIINHPVYVGRPVAWRWRKVHTKGKGTRQVERPLEQQVALDGAAPALVSDDVAVAARERLSINKWRSVRNNRNPEAALLRAGFGRCGYCGGSLNVVNHYRTGANYRCGNGQRDRYGCPGFSILAATLDAAAWSRVETILRRPDIITAEVERLRRDDPTVADVTAIDQRLAEVERKQRNLVGRLADEDDADVAALVQADIRALAIAKRQLHEERSAMFAQRAGWEQAQDRLDDLDAWCRNVAANLDALTYDQKRLALEALGVEARVWAADHQPRYQITLNIGIVSSPTGTS